MTSETIWVGLTGGRSVHLTDWPLVDSLPNDSALVGAMDRVRQVCSTALALRTSNKLRVRLPLAKLRVASADADRLRDYVDLIRDEVNVKDVELTTDVAAHGAFELTVNARAAGPRLGKDVQNVIKAVKAGNWTTSPSGAVVAGGIELREGEYERRLVSRDAGAAAELPASSGIVVLDTAVTPELEAEGLARDIVRAIQQARRDVGLSVSDRIALDRRSKLAGTLQEILVEDDSYGRTRGNYKVHLTGDIRAGETVMARITDTERPTLEGSVE